jgi:glycosyltransferase involved in cell wall biosynthesis
MQVTPVILTRDEEANIGRTLGQLHWAAQVIVLDSGSSDATESIARSFPNVRFESRPLDDLAAQWTAAVSFATTPWVLTLDADYFVPDAFVAEISALDPPPDIAGYEARFVYAIHGRPLRASLYTPRAVLLRAGAFGFYMDGHTQRVRVEGRVERLRNPIIHDDRKPLRRFIARQKTYMRDEAAKLRALPWRNANGAAKVRKLRVVAPFAVALHTLFVRRAILDGRAGWRYAFERVLAEVILSRELLRGRSSRRP